MVTVGVKELSMFVLCCDFSAKQHTPKLSKSFVQCRITIVYRLPNHCRPLASAFVALCRAETSFDDREIKSETKFCVLPGIL